MARIGVDFEGAHHQIVGREVGVGNDANGVVAHGVYPQGVVARVAESTSAEIAVEKSHHLTRLGVVEIAISILQRIESIVFFARNPFDGKESRSIRACYAVEGAFGKVTIVVILVETGQDTFHRF